MENEGSSEKNVVKSPKPEKEGELHYAQTENQAEMKTLGISEESPNPDGDEVLVNSNSRMDDSKELESKYKKEMNQDDLKNLVGGGKELGTEYKKELDCNNLNDHVNETKELRSGTKNEVNQDELNNQVDESKELKSENGNKRLQDMKENADEEEEPEPVFDGTEIPGMEPNRSLSTHSLDIDTETQGSAWPEKAVALKNFVKEKSTVAVSSVLRVLSGKVDEENDAGVKEVVDSPKEGEAKEGSQKPVERSPWNPLNYIKISREVDLENKTEQKEEIIEERTHSVDMKGRIILYTRLGCQESKEVRKFLHQKRLGYVEINIDVYPSRKLELEKNSGSSGVPKVFFNEVLIGGLNELKSLDESGKLDDKINYVISEVPSFEAPLPPLSGEDDLSSSGAIDELAAIVLKMKESVVIKDRFYRMRWFTNCFLGSEAVDFISEDQYLEREEVSYMPSLNTNLRTFSILPGSLVFIHF